MNPISDEDLVLYHYRDGLGPARIGEIERALGTDAALSARYAELAQTLAAVPASTPEPDAAMLISASTCVAPDARYSFWYVSEVKVVMANPRSNRSGPA